MRHVVEVPSVELPIPFDLKPAGQGHQHFLASGVAVVADSTWAATQGRKALKAEWDEGSNAAESSPSMLHTFQQLARGHGRILRSVGDAEAAFAGAAKKIEAEYELPLLAHAPMEPPNCTAWVRNGVCELWAPTQNAPAVRAALIMALGLPASAITIHITLIGGGFGRRLNVDYGVEAALVSKSVGSPVKVVWTRDDDLQHDYYRAAGYHRIRAGLDEQNRVAAWLHHIVLPTTTSFYEGKEGPDDDGSDIAGGDTRGGTVPHFQVEYTDPKTGIPRGWWRAVDSTGNLFVQQSFTDEVAAAAGKDPLALRRELLGVAQGPPPKPGRFNVTRLRNVFELAAVKSGWGGSLPAGRGRGITGQFGFGSYVAQVAEVSVGKDGRLKVDRIVCAADIGRPINPDMVQAQMEGAIVFGLTAALHGAITIERGRVQQSNFHDYPMLRINEMPVIEVHIVPSEEPPGGVGEPGVPPVAPAVGNAIFAAIGKRVRRLPIRAADLV